MGASRAVDYFAGAMKLSNLLPKTSRELQQIIADLSGLPPTYISVSKIGETGNFGAIVLAFAAIRNIGTHQSNIETICGQLRLKYRLTAWAGDLIPACQRICKP
jgi:hypothetical protein